MQTRRIVMHFPRRLLDQPIVCNLAKNFDLEFSIMKASVTPKVEGLLVLEIRGSKDSCSRAMEYLAEVGVQVQPLSQDITRNEARCTHCGACTSVCPAGALALDKQSMKVKFDSSKCIACELCIKACPPRAMELHF